MFQSQQISKDVLTIIVLHFALFLKSSKSKSTAQNRTDSVCRKTVLSALCDSVKYPRVCAIWENNVEELRDLPSEDTEPTVSLAGRTRNRLSERSLQTSGRIQRLHHNREGWTKFRAQDLQRCSGVGGKRVLKKQYLELPPPEMLLLALIISLSEQPL